MVVVENLQKQERILDIAVAENLNKTIQLMVAAHCCGGRQGGKLQFSDFWPPNNKFLRYPEET